MALKQTYIIGIDEAGRGPLAGPVSVGVACVPRNFDWKLLPVVDDSKKLPERKREEIFKETQKLKKEGALEYAVSMVSAPVIDRVGITYAVRLGIGRGLMRLGKDPQQTEVRLDGLLKAPQEYTFQKTIIKGDQKEKVIGLASIMAKVTRDRYMVRMAEKFPEYGFEVHKGYGTKAHSLSIKKHACCDLHRRSYCKAYF